MTSQQNVSGVENAEGFLEEMNKMREEMRNAVMELTKDDFSTGFVLLEHPLTQIRIATPTGQNLQNCILFSDENTQNQIVIQLGSTNAVIKYLIPLFNIAEMLKKMVKTGEKDFNPYEIGLIDKLLEMKQLLAERGVFCLRTEEVSENISPNETKEVNVEKKEA